MDIKKLAIHRTLRKRAMKGDRAKIAAQLAPLEERSVPQVTQGGIDPASGNGQAKAPDAGAIIVDRDPSFVPKDMMEGGYERTFMGMEPVVIVILCVMLVFIAFIAWQITQMPAK